MSEQKVAEAKATTPEGTVITIDQTAVLEYFNKRFVEFEKTLKEKLLPKDTGMGILEKRLGPDAAKLIESFKNVKDSRTVAEQWSVTIPNYTTKERSASLRGFVWLTGDIQGKAGDVVNIPYVKDFAFEVLGTVGAAFAAETTSIISTLTTTLKEAGAWSDVAYADIEKIDANLLDLLNSTFVSAATRAEDKVLVELLSACTSTNFAGTVDRKTGTLSFYAANIPKAIGLLLQAGKKITPGECVLYITPRCYAALLEELVASNAFTVAMGDDVISRGMLEQYLGVNIVCGDEIESKPRTAGATGTKELCFLFRAKRCLALAPKRDIMVETDKQIATRKLRITGSHTFGVKLLDAKECVRIFTSQAA